MPTRKRHVPVTVRPAPDFEDEIRERIRKLGWTVTKVYSHYPPFDTDEFGVVLFRGHHSTAKHADQKFKPLTAWIPQSADHPISVTEDWL